MSASPPAPASAQPAVPSSLLWAHILQRPRPPTAPPPRADLTPADKAKAATRILLHDTQSRLETFAKTAEGLLNETRRARVEVERVREECAGAGEKVADEIVGAVNRAQGVIIKAVGDPVQTQNVKTLAANVSGLSKLVDAQTHIITALQTSVGVLVEQQTRAQDRHAQTLASLTPLLALPAAIDALSLRVDRIMPTANSSPRSTTNSSSSVGARCSSPPKRPHDLVEAAAKSPAKRRKLDTTRTPSSASSASRRDVETIFPLPASAQRAHSRHSSVSSFRAHTSSASAKSSHYPTASSSAQAHTASSSSIPAPMTTAHTATATHLAPAMFETPRRGRAIAHPPSSAMRAPGSAIRLPGSAVRPPPTTNFKLASTSKQSTRASPFIAPSSPMQPRASSPLAHAAPRAFTPLLTPAPSVPPRTMLPTTRVTPRRALAGPGIAPPLPPPPRQLMSKPSTTRTSPSTVRHPGPIITRPPLPTVAPPQLIPTSAAQNTSDVELDLMYPATSSNPSVSVVAEEAEEPLMLIGSPVRPQDGRRWIDVGDSEDEEG